MDNPYTQLNYESVLWAFTLIASIVGLAFSNSPRVAGRVISRFLGILAVSVSGLRWLLPGEIWPRLCWSYDNISNDGTGFYLFLDSRWFFAFPLAFGAVVLFRWFQRGGRTDLPDQPGTLPNGGPAFSSSPTEVPEEPPHLRKFQMGQCGGEMSTAC